MYAGFLSVLVAFCSFGGEVLSLSGKGYYCRDPDTGKLYSANSTWASTSFCGNYTCKIRTKSTTDLETPLREFSLNTNTTRTINSHNNEENQQNIEETPTSTILATTVANTEDLAGPTKFRSSEVADLKNNAIDKPLENDDRYLTDSEIDKISKLLHSMKKSDLEAIVDIYSLAQDIYKDTKKSSSLKEAEAKTTTRVECDDTTDKKYWYEPLSRFNKVPSDTEPQPSNVYPAVAPAVVTPTYFQGPLQRNDFRVLPYYYPMSSFQRDSSYVQLPKQQLYNTKPCDPQPVKAYVAVSPYPQTFSGVVKKPFTVESQKQIQPTGLLPYPFTYIQRYNPSSYPYSSSYYYPKISDSTKTEADLENSVGDHNSVIGAYENHRMDDKKAIQKEEDKKIRKEESFLDSFIRRAKMDFKKPDWQTDPLSMNVLEDIRAHFEEKAKILKPFSLRKKVKLERVGKVKKLDDINRDKRSADTKKDLVEIEDQFEAFVESTMCQTGTDLGFYKMGDSSQPFPDCCPQRIEDSHR